MPRATTSLKTSGPRHRPSDVTSYHSSIADENTAGPSRWRAFSRPCPDDAATQPLTPNAARHPMCVA